MRVLLITGKGGVGKTTVAAATALRAADHGHRTLVMSTDPAHSLADAYSIALGDEPTEVVPGLAGQQIDAQRRLESHWGTVRDYLAELFDWGGASGIAAEELIVFPGMDELFALAEVQDHVTSGDFDTIVVDCAPTAETLRLLSLPDALGWYMEKLFPLERRFARVVRPVLSRVMSMPFPGDDVFQAGEGFYGRIEGIRRVLADPEITSARLVVNLEKMVIAEARRTYTYLGLFGYSVDATVVNRIIPEAVTDPYFKRWREVQAEHLATVQEAFSDLALLRLRLFDEEMVGVDRLRLVGDELYGDLDPTARLAANTPFRMFDQDGEVVLALRLPLAEKGEVDVVRLHDEVYVTVGPYRRSLVLPDSLRRREVTGARLTEGELWVRFGVRNG
ncbi:MAG TPA: TRC40/GET3/ArsA family transport-energizing ATPase [Acidimicrobiia bacterium]|nr:TRC40/GET3/ArsA family transport-energizing ATPase [Acidimicrobiia bacterium]